MKKLIPLLMIFVSFSVNAEEVKLPERRPDFCKHMVKSVEYKMPEGVEYDDDETDIGMPEEIKFPLNIDTAKTMGIELPKGVTSDMNIGEVKIDQKGNIYFNNKLLGDEVKVKLEEACAK